MTWRIDYTADRIAIMLKQYSRGVSDPLCKRSAGSLIVVSAR